jgi:hypothetical protein
LFWLREKISQKQGVLMRFKRRLNAFYCAAFAILPGPEGIDEKKQKGPNPIGFGPFFAVYFECLTNAHNYVQTARSFWCFRMSRLQNIFDFAS